MERGNDYVRFESRSEIGAIIKALEESKDKDKPDVKELIKLLDRIEMEW